MKNYALKQLDYHAWANRKVCEYLQGLTEQVYREKTAGSFPTVYDTMVHMYVIDSGWLSFFQSGGVNEMSPAYIDNLKDSVDRLVAETEGIRIEELGQLMDGAVARLRQFVEQLDDVGTNYPSGHFQASCLDYIQHIVHHGAYHRGNVTTMLRQLGHAGTPTDYGYYLYILAQQEA